MHTVHPDVALNDTVVDLDAAGTLRLTATAEGTEYESIELYDTELIASMARIMAVDITKVYTVVPMARDGEHIYVGAARELSVQSVSEAKLETVNWTEETEAAEGRALVALLNYGLEAKKLLTGAGAENNYLTTYKTQMSALTERLPQEKQDNAIVVGQDPSVIYGATGVLEDDLKLRLYFRVEEGQQENLTFTVDGTLLTTADMEEAGGTETVKFYRYTVEGITQVDYAEDILVEVVGAEDAPVARVTDTIAGYAARLSGQNAAMADAMLLYAMAAKALGK